LVTFDGVKVRLDSAVATHGPRVTGFRFYATSTKREFVQWRGVSAPFVSGGISQILRWNERQNGPKIMRFWFDVKFRQIIKFNRNSRFSGKFVLGPSLVLKNLLPEKNNSSQANALAHIFAGNLFRVPFRNDLFEPLWNSVKHTI
jgi:hypothetical protein